MEQIDRDVMRTHPDMHFFSGASTAAATHREVRRGGRGGLVCMGVWVGWGRGEGVAWTI